MSTIDHQVALLKTIADPTRLRILGLLAERPRTGAELAGDLRLTAATISHHLKQLHAVGIVTAERRGAARVHSLDEAVLGRVRGDEPRPAPVPDPEQARLVRRFFDGERLTQIPVKRKARVAVLVELLRRFVPGRGYAEAEVNQILATAHPDVAFLRRELVEYRYLTRQDGVYRVTEQVPQRDANEAQEVPAGEAAWLGALIRGSLPDRRDVPGQDVRPSSVNSTDAPRSSSSAMRRADNGVT